MIVAVDVQYAGNDAISGLVGLSQWKDAGPVVTFRHHMSGCAPYEAGNFYKRELPVILATLDAAKTVPTVIIIDGFVDLARDRPGLGRHLFEALNGLVVVVGVAKTHFKDCEAVEVLRGGSIRPLYVTAAGISADEAAGHIQSMAGTSRIPSLLKLADSIARGSKVG